MVQLKLVLVVKKVRKKLIQFFVQWLDLFLHLVMLKLVLIANVWIVLMLTSVALLWNADLRTS